MEMGSCWMWTSCDQRCVCEWLTVWPLMSHQIQVCPNLTMVRTSIWVLPSTLCFFYIQRKCFIHIHVYIIKFRCFGFLRTKLLHWSNSLMHTTYSDLGKNVWVLTVKSWFFTSRLFYLAPSLTFHHMYF